MGRSQDLRREGQRRESLRFALFDLFCLRRRYPRAIQNSENCSRKNRKWNTR